METLRKIIREEILNHLLLEISDYDLEVLKSEGAKVVENEVIGDYELSLVYIQGFYSVALSQGGKSFSTPSTQGDLPPTPITNLPLRAFLSALLKWCDKYGELLVGSHNLGKQKKYISIMEKSGLFNVRNVNENVIFIKRK